MSYKDIAKCVFAQDRLNVLFSKYVYWLSEDMLVDSVDTVQHSYESQIRIGARYFESHDRSQFFREFDRLAKNISELKLKVSALDFNFPDSIETLSLVAEVEVLYQTLANFLELTNFPDRDTINHLRSLALS